MDKQKPVKKFFIGSVTTAIWKNEGKNGPVFSTTTKRRYQKDEQWHDTDSLGEYDLLKAAQLQIRAASWIDYYKRNGAEEPEHVDQ